MTNLKFTSVFTSAIRFDAFRNCFFFGFKRFDIEFEKTFGHRGYKNITEQKFEIQLYYLNRFNLFRFI